MIKNRANAKAAECNGLLKLGAQKLRSSGVRLRS
jgi:hypothetical protein